MKLTIIGITCFIVAVGFAGNWIYNPLSFDDPFEPIPHYPDGDAADDVFHSDLTYISVEDIYYMEWNYVWLNASGHTPDTEEIRIYIKDGVIHHVELRIHYEWMKINDFTTDGNHVHIYFKPIYHTPYTTEQSYSSATLQRAMPIVFPVLIGIGLITYDNKDKFDFWRKKK